MAKPRPEPGEIGPIRFDRETARSVRARASTVDGNGGLRTLHVTVPKRELAEDALRKKAAALVCKVDEWGPHTTVEQAVEAYIEERARDGRLRPQTVEQYRQTMRRTITERLGAIPVGEMHPARVAAFMEVLATEPSEYTRGKKPLAASYRSQILTLLRGGLSIAVRRGAIASNPAREEPAPWQPQLPIVALNPSQVDALREAAARWQNQAPGFGGAPRSQFLTKYIEIGLGTAVRPAEVLAFRETDLHVGVTVEALEVTGTIVRVPDPDRVGKTKLIRQNRLKGDSQPRILEVPVMARSAILAALGERFDKSPDATILQTRRGRPIEPHNLRKIWRDMLLLSKSELEAVGVDITNCPPKILRKTGLSAIERAGGAELAAEQAGHQDVATTKAHYIERRLHTVTGTTSILDTAFGGAAIKPAAAG